MKKWQSLSHVWLFVTPWTLCKPTKFLCLWSSSGRNTGMGVHSLLQGILPTQGSNLCLLHCRWIHYHLSHQGSPILYENPLKCLLFQWLVFPYVMIFFPLGWWVLLGLLLDNWYLPWHLPEETTPSRWWCKSPSQWDAISEPTAPSASPSDFLNVGQRSDTSKDGTMGLVGRFSICL